jgi:hypothetical protein
MQWDRSFVSRKSNVAPKLIVSEPLWIVSIHLGLSIAVDKNKLIMFLLHSDGYSLFLLFFNFFSHVGVMGLSTKTQTHQRRKIIK